MGNARSSTTGGSLFTASMAKYMSLTKPQVMAVRNTLMPLASKRQGSIKRSQFQDALNQVKVSQHPDQEVLDLLFTMWDLTGTGRVPCAEFIVSMSILACKEDSVEQAIRFALQVADRNRTGKMSSKDASTLLRSLCVTASYFGDKLLTERQIYKLVDILFDTITLISQEAEALTHDEFVKKLTDQKAVQEVVCVRGETPKVLPNSSPLPIIRRSALERLQEKFNQDASTGSECSNSLGRNSLQAGTTEESCEKSIVSANYSTDFSSHMSSVMLTPLARILVASSSTAKPMTEPAIKPAILKSSIKRKVMLQ